MKTINTPQTPAPASHAHTPEPWSINGYEQWDKFGPIKRASIVAQWDNGFSETLLIATVNTTKQIEANAARIVACVNACAGMTDPAAQIKALRDALEDAEFLLRKCGNNWKEAGSMADSMKRSANDAREALSAFGGEAGK